MSKITREGVMAVINAGKEDVDALKGIYASKSCLKDGFKSGRFLFSRRQPVFEDSILKFNQNTRQTFKLQGNHELVVVRISPFLFIYLFKNNQPMMLISSIFHNTCSNANSLSLSRIARFLIKRLKYWTG